MKSWSSFSQELTEKKANKDYDGDGKVESGSKEHAGVVHNAIQRAKGKKADGQDTRKEELEIEEGKYSGSKSHIQRDGTASAPERTAAERKKDRRILAGYGKGGMKDAVERAKKERDERRKSRMKKEEVELQELDIKGAVTGALDSGSKFMKKNPVGRAVSNVLKPVGSGRGTARPSVRTQNTIRQNQQSQMNSFEPEGDQIDEFFGPKTVTPKPGQSPTNTKSVQVGKPYPARLNGRPVMKTYDKSGNSSTRPMSAIEKIPLYRKYGAGNIGDLNQRNSFEPEGDMIGEGETPMGQHPGKSPDKKVRDKYETQRRRTEAPAGVGVPDKSVGYGQLKQSFETEGEMTEGILGGAGLIAGGLAAYKAIKGMQTVNKMKNDAKSGKGLAGRLQNRTNTINKALGNSFEPEGEMVEEGKKELSREKRNKMFRRAGNLSRDAISTPISPEKRQEAHKKSGKIVKALNKDAEENNRNDVKEGYDKPDEKLKTGRKMFTIPDEERSAAAARLKEKARKKRESSCKKEEVETPVVEEAESKAQQRLMGLALSVKRGDTPMSSVTPQVARMAREMKEKDLKDFAGTKHDGLPEKVKKEEPEVSSPLVESLVESAVQRMVAKARRETAADKRLNRQASSAQQRAELNAKK